MDSIFSELTSLKHLSAEADGEYSYAKFISELLRHIPNARVENWPEKLVLRDDLKSMDADTIVRVLSESFKNGKESQVCFYCLDSNCIH